MRTTGTRSSVWALGFSAAVLAGSWAHAFDVGAAGGAPSVHPLGEALSVASGEPLVMDAGPVRVAFMPLGVLLSPVEAAAASQREGVSLRFVDAAPVAPRAGGTPALRSGSGLLDVRYAGLWPGIDIVYRATPLGPKYELEVEPGAALSRASLQVLPPARVEALPSGEIEVSTGSWTLRDSRPVAWLQDGSAVACLFEIRAPDRYGFACPTWDGTRALTIDPLVLSTFIGGSRIDEAQDVTIDADGNIIVVGWTNSNDFPVTLGAVDAVPVGPEAFVAKFAPNGSELLFATYLGGSGAEIAFAVAVDSAGSIWVAGQTTSVDFPTTPGAVARNASGDLDAFLVRLDGDGSILEYGTYLGGAGFDRALGLALDAGGNPIVIGETNSTAFPTTAGAESRNLTGDADGFLLRLNATDGSLAFSTYLGGGANDQGRAVAVLPNGSITAVGITNSSNFPIVGPSADATYNGGYDVFVATLSPQTGAVLRSAYLGGSQDDLAYCVAVDAAGATYVGGEAGSRDFPNSSGTFGPTHAVFGADGFVAKYASPAETLDWTSFITGDNTDPVLGIAVGPDGTLAMVGYATSPNFPATAGAHRTWLSGDATKGRLDAWFARASSDGSTLLYASFMGNTGNDFARAVAVDADGLAVVVGATDAYSFPTTDGALDRILNGTEGFLFKALLRRPVLSVQTDPPGRGFFMNGTARVGAWSEPCDELGTVSLGVQSPQAEVGRRHRFLNWSDGNAQNRTWQCLGDEALSVNFLTEISVDLSTDPPGLPLEVDGENVTAPASLWWTLGSPHTLGAPDPSVVNGTRYRFIGWSDGGPVSRAVVVAGALALVARYWADAVALVLETDPPGLNLSVDGREYRCPTQVWLSPGSSHTVGGPSPQLRGGARYTFSNWSDGGAQDRSHVATAPGGVLARFSAEYELRVVTHPPGLPVLVDGAETSTPWSGWRANGSKVWLGAPGNPLSLSGVEYGAMRWEDGAPANRLWIASRPEALTAVFAPVAYALRLASDPPGVPLTVAGSQNSSAFIWIRLGDFVIVGAPANHSGVGVRFSFLHWSDWGNRSHPVAPQGPLTLTAYFGRAFEFTVFPTPANASFWVDGTFAAGGASLWFDEGTVHRVTAQESVLLGAGHRLVWANWSDGGASSHLIAADAPKVLEVVFRVEYLLRVAGASGDPVCDVPTCWYAEGSTAHVTAHSPWNESAGRRQVFLGWQGPADGTALGAAVRMDGPRTLTALWGFQFYLKVVTRFGESSGSGWYDAGSSATVRVTPTEVVVDGKRFRLSGWSGDVSTTGAEGLVLVREPLYVVAVWEELPPSSGDLSFGLLVGLASLALVAGALLVRRRGRQENAAKHAWQRQDREEPPPL